MLLTNQAHNPLKRIKMLKKKRAMMRLTLSGHLNFQYQLEDEHIVTFGISNRRNNRTEAQLFTLNGVTGDDLDFIFPKTVDAGGLEVSEAYGQYQVGIPELSAGVATPPIKAEYAKEDIRGNTCFTGMITSIDKIGGEVEPVQWCNHPVDR
jgi:hypothetical protein